MLSSCQMIHLFFSSNFSLFKVQCQTTKGKKIFVRLLDCLSNVTRLDCVHSHTGGKSEKLESVILKYLKQTNICDMKC